MRTLSHQYTNLCPPNQALRTNSQLLVPQLKSNANFRCFPKPDMRFCWMTTDSHPRCVQVRYVGSFWNLRFGYCDGRHLRFPCKRTNLEYEFAKCLQNDRKFNPFSTLLIWGLQPKLVTNPCSNILRLLVILKKDDF